MADKSEPVVVEIVNAVIDTVRDLSGARIDFPSKPKEKSEK